MFFDLTYNVKEKIINTLRICFNLNKDYRHVHISDKYPLELKKLPAIIVKNASAPLERQGVDDYIHDVITKTGEIVETFKKGNSIKSLKRQFNRLLYCIRKPEVFRIEILEDNQISFIRQSTRRSFGPIPILPGSVVKDMIYDVEIEFDEILVPGDFIVFLLIPIGGSVARLYGGICDMELSMTVMAESPPELQWITDWTMMYLNFVKKQDLEREQNILIKTVRHTGETEIPEQKNFIYTAGVDVSLRSQWSWTVPIDQHIIGINIINTGVSDTCEGIPISVID